MSWISRKISHQVKMGAEVLCALIITATFCTHCFQNLYSEPHDMYYEYQLLLIV